MRGKDQQAAATPEDDEGLDVDPESATKGQDAYGEHTGMGHLVAGVSGDTDHQATLDRTSPLAESRPAQRSQAKQKASSSVEFPNTWALNSNNGVALSGDDDYETQTGEQTIAGFEQRNRYDLRHLAKTRKATGTFGVVRAKTKSTAVFSGLGVKTDEAYDELEDASGSVENIPKTNSRVTLWPRTPSPRKAASTLESPDSSASNNAVQTTTDTYEYALNDGPKRKYAIDSPASNK